MIGTLSNPTLLAANHLWCPFTISYPPDVSFCTSIGFDNLPVEFISFIYLDTADSLGPILGFENSSKGFACKFSTLVFFVVSLSQKPAFWYLLSPSAKNCKSNSSEPRLLPLSTEMLINHVFSDQLRFMHSRSILHLNAYYLLFIKKY